MQGEETCQEGEEENKKVKDGVDESKISSNDKYLCFIDRNRNIMNKIQTKDSSPWPGRLFLGSDGPREITTTPVE